MNVNLHPNSPTITCRRAYRHKIPNNFIINPYLVQVATSLYNLVTSTDYIQAHLYSRRVLLQICNDKGTRGIVVKPNLPIEFQTN